MKILYCLFVFTCELFEAPPSVIMELEKHVSNTGVITLVYKELSKESNKKDKIFEQCLKQDM